MNDIYICIRNTNRTTICGNTRYNEHEEEQIVISETSARAAESAGVVPKKASGVTLNISLNVKLASKDPASCAPIYDGTCPKHCIHIS